MQNVIIPSWLCKPGGSRPSNTCTPPSFPGNVPAQPWSVPTPKSTLASITNWQISAKSLFYKKNQKKCLANSLWATENLPNVKFGIFACSTNSVPTLQRFCFYVFEQTRIFFFFFFFFFLKVEKFLQGPGLDSAKNKFEIKNGNKC